MGDAIKMKLETKDLVAENVQKIANLFPNCVTEKETADGRLEKAINWKMLKQMLKGKVIDGEEAYEFSWVGKKAAIVEANKPIRKTLRPCKEESKNWDTTENLYIEGDNLEALKLLQESYLGKVKMIYIDPPYNTGHDFVYPDNFMMGEEDYNEGTKYFAEDGTINFSRENSKQAGRYHSDWCSMMYSRLVMSRNILSDDGIIFISIDDNEHDDLKKICDEVFGESNFVAIINWKGRGGRQDSRYYAAVHEYIYCYAKNKENFVAGEEVKTGDVYPKFDEEKKRFYKTQLLRKWGSNSRREDRPNLFYPIIAPDGTEVYPIIMEKDKQNPSIIKRTEGRWRHGVDTMKQNIEEGKVEFVKLEDGSWLPYEKIFAPLEGEEKTKKYTTWIDDSNDGASIVKNLFSSGVFDYPKSPSLINHFLKMGNVEDNDIVLDFFSGSATTAHAVMQLNAEDGGHRKFIMVQLPEPTDKKSEAHKAGYKNICEIGKERIRRAGDKIVADNADKEGMADLDIGFRVLKVDSSNMNDVYYGAEDYSQQLLLQMEDNIKSDRTELDLLFGCIVDWGLELSCPYASTEIEGYTVHNYNDGDLVACFAENIPESVIKAIAKMEPMRAVFRDSGFVDSPAKINVTEIFKRLSPDTDVRVI